MQHTDKAIAEFEAWAGGEAFGLSPAHFEKDEAGEYINYPTQCYWLVWQASRAKLVIELPPAIPMPDEDSYDDPDEFEQAEALALTANGMRHACRAAIEAAGVTVRG
ncbi:hypothetical protein [Stutzerimonas frequens]|uniref:Uncharacterized protein n=1 Tax=Stutzerimonas frequens TaxID=2968969 RepID=A0AA47HXZ8_9GAMM|nr:hypothetical protein [Stutzerimonas frequens]WAE51221.1 hypothetical protein OSV15_16260 [Stutzerimonas frequens]